MLQITKLYVVIERYNTQHNYKLPTANFEYLDHLRKIDHPKLRYFLSEDQANVAKCELIRSRVVYENLIQKVTIKSQFAICDNGTYHTVVSAPVKISVNE